MHRHCSEFYHSFWINLFQQFTLGTCSRIKSKKDAFHSKHLQIIEQNPRWLNQPNLKNTSQIENPHPNLKLKYNNKKIYKNQDLMLIKWLCHHIRMNYVFFWHFVLIHCLLRRHDSMCRRQAQRNVFGLQITPVWSWTWTSCFFFKCWW